MIVYAALKLFLCSLGLGQLGALSFHTGFCSASGLPIFIKKFMIYVTKLLLSRNGIKVA
jgi:hypothetical protein